jgi:hypothetical protein
MQTKSAAFVIVAVAATLSVALLSSACWAPPPAATPTKTLPPLVLGTPTARPSITPQLPTVAPTTKKPAATPTLAPPTATPLPTEIPTAVVTSVPLEVRMTSPDYGIQAFLWWRPEIADRDLTLIKEAGFNWVRQTFDWNDIEGAGKGARNWEKADEVVRLVNEKGLKLLLRVSMDPEHPVTWAGSPPENANNLADLLFDAATRYQGMVHAYQIWNEPNLAREWGGKRPDPAGYVILLKKAYSAIKRADPNAVVITAGMAPTGTDDATAMPDEAFYEGMYQAMGGNSTGYFDVLGVHGAGFAAPPELDPAQAAADPQYGGYRFFSFRHVEDIRKIMVKYGDDAKRVAILEFGWTSDPVNPAYKWHGADAGITEELKGKYLICAMEYAKQHWQPWIGLMSIITMPNLAWLEDGDPKDEEQYWWAIMEPSPIDQKYLRAAYVLLQNYLLRQQGIDAPPLPGGGSTEGMCPTM